MEIQKRILLSQYLLIIVGSINLLLVYGGSYIPSSHMYGLHYTHPDWFFLATLPSIIMIPLGIFKIKLICFFFTTPGLTHLKADGSWQVFKTDNSNLPDDNVWALLDDDQGGIIPAIGGV